MKDKFVAIIIVIIGSLCFLSGIVTGIVVQKKAAVENGKAEYYLDDNYERQWRWKP